MCASATTPSSYVENTLNGRHSFTKCRLAIPAHNSCPSTTTHHPFTFDVLSRNNVSLSHPPPTSSSLQLSTQVLYHKREGGWMQGLETVKLFIFNYYFFFYTKNSYVLPLLKPLGLGSPLSCLDGGPHKKSRVRLRHQHPGPLTTSAETC